jgi:tetratricopeptide (TPR) repeat protein
LTNKSIALRLRGTARFNAAVESKDESVKNTGLEAAKKDWQASSVASTKAIELLRAVKPSADPAAAAAAKSDLYPVLVARAEAMRLLVRLDPTRVAEAETAFLEYLAVETNSAKMAKAERDLAQMLFDGNEFNRARLVYDKVLTRTPDDLNALKIMGMILYQLGTSYETDGKMDEAQESYQQAANYFKRFVDLAPAGPDKNDVEGLLDLLKEERNIEAE